MKPRKSLFRRLLLALAGVAGTLLASYLIQVQLGAPIHRMIYGKTVIEQDCDGIPQPCILMGMGPTINDGPSGIAAVGANGNLLLTAKRYADLDALINRYSKLQDRLLDGRFKLGAIGKFLDDSSNTDVTDDVASWREVNPKSAGAALLEADYWTNAAWRARGSGLANTVAPEGWELFRERLRRAERALNASKPYAAANPLWYMQYLEVDLGLEVPLEARIALYEQGIKAFPEFFPLHLAMIRGLSPQWSGSDAAIPAFIETVVKRSPQAVQAEMYTRLWWYTDGYVAPNVNVFREMGASWFRMKDGFESLVKSHPDSAWIPSNYASFACRVGDMTTYTRLRVKLGNKTESIAFPSNASLDVCDARAAGKPI
jgi:hypothetical protein